MYTRVCANCIHVDCRDEGNSCTKEPKWMYLPRSEHEHHCSYLEWNYKIQQEILNMRMGVIWEMHAIIL